MEALFMETNTTDPVIKYTIPFEWGMLRVTQEADASYGLIPLSPDVVMGDSPAATEATDPSSKSEADKIDITVAGPQEIQSRMQTPTPDRIGWMGGLMIADASGDASKITIGFSLDAVELRQRLTERTLSGLGLDVEAAAAFQEVLEQDVPQMLAHELAEKVSLGSTQMLEKKKRQERAVEGKRRLRRLGRLSVGAVTALLGVDVLTNNINPISMGFIAADSAAFLGLHYVQKRLYRRTGAGTRKFEALESVIRGARVGADVHAAFCSNVFDAGADKFEA
jgi:hypothetical protein